MKTYLVGSLDNITEPYVQFNAKGPLDAANQYAAQHNAKATRTKQFGNIEVREGSMREGMAYFKKGTTFFFYQLFPVQTI